MGFGLEYGGRPSPDSLRREERTSRLSSRRDLVPVKRSKKEPDKDLGSGCLGRGPRMSLTSSSSELPGSLW